MWQFLFFIIFILLIQGLSKILEKETKKRNSEEKPVTEEELEKYFETLGFPTLRIPKPKREKPPEKKKEEKVEVPVIKEEKPLLKPEISKIEKKILPEFLLERLEEGIILSEILGPPKALRKPRW